MTCCQLCTKRVVNYKIPLTCSICTKQTHYKCSNLSKKDVAKLSHTKLINDWICTPCNTGIFPFFKDLCSADTAEINKSKNTPLPKPAVQTCHTCSNKLGKLYSTCDHCSNNSHLRCFAGLLGCRRCASDTIPGFKCSTYELYPEKNNLLFNPYSDSSAANQIGHDFLDNPSENVLWTTASDNLINCNYRELSDISPSRPGELRVLSLNIQSLIKNIDQIRDEIDHYKKFDVICFNETNCLIKDLPFGGVELQLQGFNPPLIQEPSRASGRGGGLAIYVNANLAAPSSVTTLSEFCANNETEHGEHQVIEIARKNQKNIIICNMYRSPSKTPTKFIEHLEFQFKQLSKHNKKHIIFTSDSNIDLINYESSVHAKSLVDLYTQYGYVSVISRPTHFWHTSNKPTLIDHIFCNSLDRITSSGIITDPISDHLGTYVTLLIDLNKPNNRYHSSNDILSNQENQRDMSNANLQKFRDTLQSTDWLSVTDTVSAQEKYTKFSKIYSETYDSCFPVKKHSNKKDRDSKPWMLPWLAEACKRKNKAHTTFIKLPTSKNKGTYQKLKKFTTKHIKKAKFKYYANYFAKYTNDGRKQWQMINTLLNRNKTKQKVNKIISNGETLTNNTDISSAFNSYFCNIATDLKHETSDYNKPSLDPNTRITNNMGLLTCTPAEILEIIKNFKNKATSDTAVQALKHANSMVAPIISELINTSFEQGVFPSDLKLAKVIPLHKAGSRSDLSNYRPISLLPLFSKIYEKVMHNRLYSHLTKYNIICETQFGFRAGHSCEHALLTAQNTILSTLSKKEVAVLLLIDFSKAFDMVDHRILLYKLEHYGVRSNILSWFKSYLTDRRQYVNVNNTASSIEYLRHGVPQGSILGPLLFIIYINDIPQISKLAKFILYADDANIIVTGNNLREIEEKIKNLIPLLLYWIGSNGLKLNIKKTKYLIFSNKIKHDIVITISGTQIERKTSERFLGILMDENLNWNMHRMALATKISRNAGILYKLRGTIPLNVLQTLYYSFVQSHLCFCPAVWGLGSVNSLSKIFSAQKKAVRGIASGYSNYYFNKDTGELPSHTKNTFNEHGILTVHNLVLYQTMTTMSKVYRKIAPKSICNLFVKNHNLDPDHNARQKTLDYFLVNRTRLVSEDKTIFNKGPRLFNDLVTNINKIILEENAQLKSRQHRQPLLQNKFTSSFKSKIKAYILSKQKIGTHEWIPENDILHSQTPQC